MREVVGLEVARVETRPLGAEVVVLRAQRLGRLGVGHDRPNLLPDHLGDDLVGLGVDRLVGEDAEDAKSSPASYAASKRARRSSSEHIAAVSSSGSAGMPPRECFAASRYAARSASIAARRSGGRGPLCAGTENAGVRWNTVSCRGLLGDERDRLHRRRAGADDRDPLPGEVDAFVRPTAGEVHVAGEPVGSFDVDLLRHRQAAGRHHVVAGTTARRRRRCARRHSDAASSHAAAATRVEKSMSRRRSYRSATNCRYRQDLGLRGVLLGPRPVALELGIEAVRVVGRRDVAPGAGIAVPVPGAADVVGRLEDGGSRSPSSPEPAEQVEPREAGAHDHHVVVRPSLLRTVASSHVRSPLCGPSGCCREAILTRPVGAATPLASLDCERVPKDGVERPARPHPPRAGSRRSTAAG